MVTTGELLAYAQLAADVRGCNCEPHIDITELRPGIFNANIQHDHHCPALAGDAA